MILPTKLKYQEKSIKTNLTAYEFFKKIEQKYANCFLLESLEKDFKEARYSMIGFNPFCHLAAKGQQLFIDYKRDPSLGEKQPPQPLLGKEGLFQSSTIKNSKYKYKTTQTVNNPYEELEKLTKKIQQLIKGKLPNNFSGGLVGYFSYEATKYFEPAFKGKINKQFFDFEFGLYFDGLLFDNKLKKVKYFYLAENRLALIKDLLQQKTPSDELFFSAKPLGDDIKKIEYKNLAKEAKKQIIAGEIFQLIISRQYKYQIIGQPLAAYQKLRQTDPSPHMFFLRFADRYLLGSFPELVVQVENGIIKNFPIAGTRRRGVDAKQDKLNEKELLSNEKELAEHVMLIDLGRNDLGRICQFGSVKVIKKMFIKKFSQVMHICSEITGRLLKNKSMFDAVAVSLPMGTVSGAPKVRAMELINKYEKEARGPYSGAIGYLALNGNCKFTAGLRSLFISQGQGSIRAGAGIVYDSDPEFEFQETENKLRGIKKIVES